MKKVISLGLSLALILSVYMGANFNCKKTSEIVNTQELPELLNKFDFEKLYTCKQDIRKHSDNIIELDIEEAQLLLKVSRREGGDTLDGQLWTMRTIYNRVISDSFDNTIQEVIEQPGQFEVFANGSYKYADINANTHIALAMLEGGWDETQGALYWEADTNSDESWHKRNLIYIKTIEGNRYYR